MQRSNAVTKNWKAGITSALFSLSMLGVGIAMPSAVNAQVVTPPPGARPAYQRGEYGSNRNLRRIHRRLEQIIDELQHDQHDYGGHRVQTIDLLQQARAQLIQAEQWEAAHPGQ